MIVKREWDLDANISDYLDEETGVTYARVIGGVVLPGHKPGWAVVLAEDKVADQRMGGEYHKHLIASHEDRDIGALIEWMVMKAGMLYAIEDWYGDVNDPDQHLVRLYNERHHSGVQIGYSPVAGQTGEFRFGLHLVKQCGNPDRQVLHLDAVSGFEKMLHEVSESDAVDKGPKDFPAVAALAYALSVLKQPRRSSREVYLEGVREKTQKTYNPLTYGLDGEGDGYDPLNWGLK